MMTNGMNDIGHSGEAQLHEDNEPGEGWRAVFSKSACFLAGQ